MTTVRRSGSVIAVVVVSALVAVSVVAGPAAALGASTAAPFPHSPGTTVETFPISVTAGSGDAVTKNGMKSMTLDFGADNGFDGNVKNVSVSDMSVAISAKNGGYKQVSAFNAKTKPNGRVVVNFQNPVSVAAGDRIVARVGNVTTASVAGDYTVDVSTTATNGVTDGPVSVGYEVVAADITFPNQSASQFGANQSVTINGVVPNTGYVAVFTKTANGSRGKLVGHSKPIVAVYRQRNYTVDLGGKVKKSQPLVAVTYYETSGSTQGDRLNGSFDPTEDGLVTNDGVVANATGYVTTVDADEKLTAGEEYDQGARLFFDQGGAGTSYRVNTVTNGSLGRTINQFQTAKNGTAVVDTTGLKKGQYALTRIDNGSVVGLDDDSTTSLQDDSFFITGQQFVQNTTSAATNATGGANAGGNATAGSTNASGGASTDTNASGGASAGAGGNGSVGANASNGGNANVSNNSNGSGGSGGSGAFGPGFGIVVALVAVLGAVGALVRRER